MQFGRLILQRAEAPIEEPVTKLGGLPVWVDKPAWPISAATGEPLLFIGQIVIDPRLFPVDPGRIAYLFMTGGNAGKLGTWSPNSSESAVIIQQISPHRKTTIIEGPRLMESFWEGTVRMERPLELMATVNIEEAIPEDDADEIFFGRGEDLWKDYLTGINQKIGGEPNWIQGDETPDGWRLLLQLPESPKVNGRSVETNLNFGTGSAYVFVSPDYSQGVLLWQC
jgi:hypothetical protein